MMTTVISKCRQIGQLLRMRQWVKNLFIFAPLVFSGQLFHLGPFIDCSIVFFGFCLVTGSMYILNDFIDKEADRVHPQKSHRFFVQVRMEPGTVIVSVCLFAIAGIVVCSTVNHIVPYVVLIYILLHLVYNSFAKNIVILDVIFIAVGFLVRIWVGASATFILPSVWLQMCVLVLALFLGFSKRKYEFLLLKRYAGRHRRSLNLYTPRLLEHLIVSCATLTIAFYSLYAIDRDTVSKVGYGMIYSVIFVIYGIFRYMYLVNVKKVGEDPSDLFLLDHPFMMNLCLWCVYVIILFYRLAVFR